MSKLYCWTHNVIFSQRYFTLVWKFQTTKVNRLLENDYNNNNVKYYVPYYTTTGISFERGAPKRSFLFERFLRTLSLPLGPKNVADGRGHTSQDSTVWLNWRMMSLEQAFGACPDHSNDPRVKMVFGVNDTCTLARWSWLVCLIRKEK